jgi:hypothetical protein
LRSRFAVLILAREANQAARERTAIKSVVKTVISPHHIKRYGPMQDATITKMTSSGQSLKIEVFFDFRDDGGLRAWSPNVPDLVLSHADPRKVIDDVPLALEVILSAKYSHAITIRPDGDSASVIEEIRAHGADPGRAAAHEFTAIAA